MTITKDIAAKFAVAIVAVSMVLSAFAPVAKAQTTEDLQKMINDLLAQVAALQSQAGQGGSSTAAGVCPYTWTRDLAVGATGADVMKLQQFLNADADTRVAAEGAGSVGMETEYFGPATAAAVSKMQVKYRADILSPSNLVNPTGYFGASSRAKANALCAAAPVVTPGEDATDEDEDEDAETGELSGEASLDSFEMDTEESSVEEGESDAVVGLITVEFADGDAEISRLDMTLQGDQTGAKPWDAFDTVSLWVDGDMIAEMDASDEDDYLDEDTGEIRFSGLDIVAMEDEEVEIMVAVSVQNNLDAEELDSEWTFTPTAIRYFDADGVATTEDGSILEGTAEFDMDIAGADEEVKVSLASSNPDASDIVVDTDTDTNDVTILVADIEAEDNDIELNTVVVKLAINADGATTTNITNVLDEVRVVIDGQEFEAEAIGTEADYAVADNDAGSPVATGLTEGYSERAAATTTVWYLFDIDGDVVIDEDSEVEMEVVVDLNDTDDAARYPNGVTLSASVQTAERNLWQAEGAEDLESTQFTGTAVGKAHTLVAEGILVPVDGFSSEVDTLGTNDTIGEFTLEFEVTAIEGDFYITDNASTSATDGVTFTVDGTIGTGSVSASLTSSADEDTAGVFTVREGETETFTLVVTVDPQNTGTFKVALDGIWYSTNELGTGGDEYVITNASDFDTAPQSIQGS